MKNARVRVTCSVFPEGFGIIFGGLIDKVEAVFLLVYINVSIDVFCNKPKLENLLSNLERKIIKITYV